MVVTRSFLEVAVAAEDILGSLAFYRALGFSELVTGDTRSHKYAVVTDGSLTIGLHDRAEMPGMTLTFVQPELRRHVLGMVDEGVELELCRLDEDEFNEALWRDPDGHAVSLVEARTYSPPADGVDRTPLGRFLELSLPVRDAVTAARFWAPLAPRVLAEAGAPHPVYRLDAAGLPLGLHETAALRAGVLSFVLDHRDALDLALERASVMPDLRAPPFGAGVAALTAPEGTRLIVFERDFLDD